MSKLCCCVNSCDLITGCVSDFLQVKSSFKPEREPSDDSDSEVEGRSKEKPEQDSDHPVDIDDLLGNGVSHRDYEEQTYNEETDFKPKSTKKKSHKKKSRQQTKPEEPPLISFDDDVISSPPTQTESSKSKSIKPQSRGYGSTGYGSTGGGTVVNPNANMSSNLLDDWSTEDWGSGWTANETKSEDPKPTKSTLADGWDNDDWTADGWEEGGADGWSNVDLQTKSD